MIGWLPAKLASMGKQATILVNEGILLPATSELTDSEIQSQYGLLMREAVSAFRDDPAYIVSMAEAAASHRSRRRSATKM